MKIYLLICTETVPTIHGNAGRVRVLRASTDRESMQEEMARLGTVMANNEPPFEGWGETRATYIDEVELEGK